MLPIRIQRPNEIRCPCCLQWNAETARVCGGCAAPVLDLTRFGAVRAILRQERCDPRRVQLFLNEEQDERIHYWQASFEQQLHLGQRLLSECRYVLAGVVLDVQDEIEQEFLSLLPLRPEVVQEYRDYQCVSDSLEPMQQLQYLYRAHPIRLVKALATMALIRLGQIDRTSFNELFEWRPQTKQLHRERLLVLAHWSVQNAGFYSAYAQAHAELVCLYDRDGQTGQWARLSSYLAGYNRDELRLELEQSVATSSGHWPLSCALALRQYESIKTLLLGRIDATTLVLALRYSDKRHLAELIAYLDYAPAQQRLALLRRCVALTHDEPQYQRQIVQWLICQAQWSYFEVIFVWSSIPRWFELIQLLASHNEGLRVLNDQLPQWLQQHATQDVLEVAAAVLTISGNALTQAALAELQQRVFEFWLKALSDRVRERPQAAEIAQLLHWVFQADSRVSTAQRGYALHSLTRAADAKTADGHLLLNLPQLHSLSGLDSAAFATRLLGWLQDTALQSVCGDWLNALYAAALNQSPAYEPELKPHLLLVSQWLRLDVLPAMTLRYYYQLLYQQRLCLLDEPELQQVLSQCLANSRDRDQQYWLSQLLRPET